ncbi:MAG: TolC family protein, partial [Saprospiraceae bacterium]
MMKRLQLLLFLLITLLSASSSFGQDKWDLATCIVYARAHNITIKQGELRQDIAQINLEQARHGRYPNLNASVNLGNSYGRTIDPTTNTFRNSTLGFNSFNLNSGVNLFSGGRVHYQIQQNKLEIEAASLDVAELNNNISLMVAQAYINVLFGLENYKNAKANLDLTQNQVDQLMKFIKAGVRPENDKLEVEAQIAQNKQDIVVAQNAIDQAYLNLRQLLLIPEEQKLEIAEPILGAAAELAVKLPQLDEVYKTALANQPQIKAAEVRLASNHVAEKVGKSAYYPSLGLNAGMNSNYSSVNSLFSAGPLVYSAPTQVLIDGQAIEVQFSQP